MENIWWTRGQDGSENDIPRPVKAEHIVDAEQSWCSMYDYSRGSRDAAYLVRACRIEESIV